MDVGKARPLQFLDRTLTKRPTETSRMDEETSPLHCFYISQSQL